MSPPRATGRRAKKKEGRGRDQAAEEKVGKAEPAATVEVSMESKVETMVTQQFLFLMSNVVSKRWSSRTTKDKIRAIKVGANLPLNYRTAIQHFFFFVGFRATSVLLKSHFVLPGM